MVKERELKVTDINKDEVIKRLKSLDAKYVGTYMYRRLISIPKQNGKGESWFRIRSDGKKHVVTFKQKNGSRLAQEKYEMQIAEIGEYAKIFMDAPHKLLYFENKRVEYNLEGNKITIDKWPYLPWSLEIEGNSKNEIMKMFRRLALKKGRPLGNMSGRKGYSYYGLDYEEIGTRNLNRINRFIKG
jgi:adenylate cyclase class IV